MIRAGHVGKGFSEDETMLAAGEPDDVIPGEDGKYTWVYKRSNNMLLYVDFNPSRTVVNYYTKSDPKAKKRTTTKRRPATKKRRSSSNSWQNGKGTPL